MPQQSGGNRDQGAGGNRFVQFSRGAAQRIANVVRTVEAGNRSQSGVRFDHPVPTQFGSGSRAGAGQQTFRIGETTGAWSQYAPHSVHLKYATTTPAIVTAVNVFASITKTDAYNVAIHQEGTAWYLIYHDQDVNSQGGGGGGGGPPNSHLLAKTKYAWNKESFAYVRAWGGVFPYEFDLGYDVYAINRFANVAANKWVMLGNVNYTWYLVAAECG